MLCCYTLEGSREIGVVFMRAAGRRCLHALRVAVHAEGEMHPGGQEDRQWYQTQEQAAHRDGGQVERWSR